MDRDTNPTPPEASVTDEPAQWQAEQMETEDGDETAVSPIDERPDPKAWNEGEMAPARKDGSRSPEVPDEEIAESKGGLSGGGSNPGGGERWAERNRESSG